MKERDGWGVALALGALCLLAGLAAVFRFLYRPMPGSSVPATAEECRAAAEALGLPFVEEATLAPLLPEGLALKRFRLATDRPRSEKAVGYAMEFTTAGASLLYSLRTEGGLFEVHFTMDGLYTDQVRADAAEKALQLLAALAAQSPESGGQNLSAAGKMCIMERGLNRG